MTLWLFAVTPTRFPAATRSTIISAPTVVLPGARRSLDRQVRVAQLPDEPPRGVARVLALAHERQSPPPLPDGTSARCPGNRRSRADLFAGGAALTSTGASQIVRCW